MKYIVNPEAAYPCTAEVEGRIVWYPQGEEYPAEALGRRPDEIKLLLTMKQIVEVAEAPVVEAAEESRGKKARGE